MFTLRDPDYDAAPADTYASELKRRFDAVAGEGAAVAAAAVVSDGDGTAVVTVAETDGGELILVDESIDDSVDVFANVEAEAIAALQRDDELKDKISSSGCPWGKLNAFFAQHLPELLEDRSDVAFRLVPKALDRVFGEQEAGGWHTFKHPVTNKTWVKAGPQP
jgi:hypothetical protein